MLLSTTLLKFSEDVFSQIVRLNRINNAEEVILTAIELPAHLNVEDLKKLILKLLDLQYGLSIKYHTLFLPYFSHRSCHKLSQILDCLS